MDITFLTGIGASIFTAASTLPQLIKILRNKKADDLSISMFIILFIGLVLWVGYGVFKKDWIIIVSNSFSLVVNMAIVGAWIRYRNN
jgi:MtN3 and saliva related transmembrane protein